MKAVRIYEHGKAEELKYEDIPIPELKEGEVLIQVKAISLNHFDILSRKGIYPKMKLPRVIGMDCAGEVIDSKSKNSKWKQGDKVLVLGETLGLGGPGAYSEFVNVPEEEVFAIPEGLSFQESASIGISYLTAYYAVVEKLGDIKEKFVFIPGASGGVGSALIQMCKCFGAKVIAGSRSKNHCESALKLGADYAINITEKNAIQQIIEICSGNAVDIAINAVGGESIAFCMNVLKKKQGKLVIIGSASGRNVNIDIFQLLIQEMILIGCNFGSLEPWERGEIYQQVKKLFSERKIKVILDKEFPLSLAVEAHKHMESGEHFGKIILIP
ncbi:MAG: zinc-binding alcohol dehydrogenase family protein [Leptospiraceae bacterium]|nr:zinc-binding alcohol dehydrogenase family protein [Leptospiraceae bacterium]